ncbi:phosphotransferase [Glaciecola sp. HTCC2999]|jgi:serine/threonine protein kinase|uniref:phosphotransferase n=1 Tax=Glaciecola sp. HTCC2999 TaxID=455436 RepID=UPI0000E0EA04|nr:phosphotransferase [Glaciecola sp. HTCC2999]
MIQHSIIKILTQQFNTSNIEYIETVQSLWSGYGSISRYRIDTQSVIVKTIDIQTQQREHPRGWQTNFAHQRKISSYQNECIFYNTLAPLSHASARVPACLYQHHDNDVIVLVLEDLDAFGFNVRLNDAQTLDIAKQVLHWLAHFHIQFLQVDRGYPHPSPVVLDRQWSRGSYWHLATRPDEFQNMPDSALKRAAHQLDDALQHAQYQTLIHGDAKIANFCFDMTLHQVAAVDFQYCGKGVGIVDVMYFLGSALSNSQLTQHADELVTYYFSHIHNVLNDRDGQVDVAALITEWESLYCVAWADFERFLVGWSPGHKKLHAYSKAQTLLAIS